MPRVKTRYFAVVREVVGLREEEIEVPEGATLQDFIKILTDRYGKLRKVILDEKGELKTGYNVAHNTTTVPKHQLDKKKIKDGDEVVILPPIGGGSQRPKFNRVPAP